MSDKIWSEDKETGFAKRKQELAQSSSQVKSLQGFSKPHVSISPTGF